jgi:hypothetical protein
LTDQQTRAKLQDKVPALKEEMSATAVSANYQVFDNKVYIYLGISKEDSARLIRLRNRVHEGLIRLAGVRPNAVSHSKEPPEFPGLLLVQTAHRQILREKRLQAFGKIATAVNTQLQRAPMRIDFGPAVFPQRSTEN